MHSSILLFSISLLSIFQTYPSLQLYYLIYNYTLTHAQQPNNAPVTERQSKLAWINLDIPTRRKITARSKHVFQIYDDLYIDAHNVLYLRDEMESNVVAKRLLKEYDIGGITYKKHAGAVYSYKEDEELAARYTVSAYPVLYWYKGLLINDQEQWLSDKYEPLRKFLEIESNKSPRDIRKEMLNKIRRLLPIVFVVDPLSQMTARGEIYSTGENRQGQIGSTYGRQCGPLDNQNSMDFAKKYPATTLRSTGSFTLAPQEGLVKGLPNEKHDFLLLIPSNRFSGARPALGPQSRRKQIPRYEIANLIKHRLSPTEFYTAFLNEQIEIPVRTVTQEGDAWICEERLIERP